MEKEKLLSLYSKYVSEDFQCLFPFAMNGVAVVKTKQGFEFSRVREGQGIDRAKAEDQEWMVPNLINLSVRAAIEKLASHIENKGVREWQRRGAKPPGLRTHKRRD